MRPCLFSISAIDIDVLETKDLAAKMVPVPSIYVTGTA